ncbi:hypothetical protein VitviT2T_022873 [Vitis vinifera]|uniref:Reverse transcriptase Ty1/copia-type domain-containing protein n=1 Tax=Vitis vinifera TaxID=29760 RepID=A0ABY9DDS6_VITVI|nr:hypothetical protein VitviT2T_022873 [Vitis vinifera]
MKDNGVGDLIELPEGVKPIGCKWIFKTKRDSKGNIVRYKARLVAKGFTQKEGIDYKEAFSPVSLKDSFRIIMALVAHYDLKLHQMDVKTAFLNGNIDEVIYMVRPENFESNDSKQLVCKLKRSIYSLKQASRQWYWKFDQVITSFGFKENIVDQCIYLKFSGSKFIILGLYVNDILLVSCDVGLLHETKRFLSSKFDMKDLGDASFMLVYRSIGIVQEGTSNNGLDIPHSDKGFVGLSNDSKQLDAKVHRKCICGDCDSSYMETLMNNEPRKYQPHFKEYIKKRVESDGLPFTTPLVREFTRNPNLHLVQSLALIPPTKLVLNISVEEYGDRFTKAAKVEETQLPNPCSLYNEKLKIRLRRRQIYVPYNILPLDPDSANQAIMRYPDIQVAVYAPRNTRGLPWPRDYKKKNGEDILDWLQAMFRFQKDNVASKREHLILLLANVY